MSMLKYIIYIAFALSAIACNADVVAPAEGCSSVITRYESEDPDVVEVKAIIDQTCSYSGCHDGAGGIGPGNYTRYQGMLRDLENGSFASRVIDVRENPSLGMPPDQSVYPQSLQDDLTEVQLEIITCWLQEGFPQ